MTAATSGEEDPLPKMTYVKQLLEFTGYTQHDAQAQIATMDTCGVRNFGGSAIFEEQPVPAMAK